MHFETDCTRNHTAEFTLSVSEIHCSREGAFSKTRFLVCQKRRTDRKLCCNCWLCSYLLPERSTKTKTAIWFYVKLCAKCVLHGCLCEMENRETIFYVAAILKNSDSLRQRRKTITTRIVWEKYVEMFLSTAADTKLRLCRIFSQCQLEGVNFSNWHSVYCLELINWGKINFIK